MIEEALRQYLAPPPASGRPFKPRLVTNHGMSGVLKNAIDWGSRPPNAFDRKVAASFGTTVGAYGTARSQMNVRLCLSPLNDAGGALGDPKVADDLRAVGRVLVQAIRAGFGRL